MCARHAKLGRVLEIHKTERTHNGIQLHLQGARRKNYVTHTQVERRSGKQFRLFTSPVYAFMDECACVSRIFRELSVFHFIYVHTVESLESVASYRTKTVYR